ncbi:FUSC family protein [Microbacterium sp. X-17]|uniref:FUSC family protein n=1 Tax=Microbacterium sp. X-17 TaxID=3144404 RepID=UPI0031F4C667
MSVTARMTKAVRAPQRGPFLQVVKSIVATLAAWLIAPLLIPGPPPIFAAIAALLVVQPSVNQSFTRAIEYTAGVIAGVVFASGLSILFGPQPWVILVAVAGGLLLAWALRMTPVGSNQIAISALLVLSIGVSTPAYALDRVIETLIGAVLGFIVNLLIVPPVLARPAQEKIDALGAEMAAAFDRLADALVTPQTPAQREDLMTRVRLLRPLLATANAAVAAAAESLTFNPRGRRHREELAELAHLLEKFTPIVTQLSGMTRGVYDRYDPDLGADPIVREIADQLRRAGHDTLLLLRRAEPSESTMTAELPVLTTPLVVAQAPRHWILVGALVEDLRRVHENLTTD